jgi:hypothetical protein
VAFTYESKNVAAALGAGIENARSLEERPVDFQYKAGTPIRFAGEQIAQNLGANGEFGTFTNNRKDKEAQEYLRRFAKQWTSGPFAPDAPAREEVA